MILRITVGDNDFTEELEQFAKDPEGAAYLLKVCKPENIRLTPDEKLALFKRADRFRELFYNTDKYTPVLASELCDMIRQNWENFVNHVMCDHDWWDEEEYTDEYTISGSLLKEKDHMLITALTHIEQLKSYKDKKQLVQLKKSLNPLLLTKKLMI